MRTYGLFIVLIFSLMACSDSESVADKKEQIEKLEKELGSLPGTDLEKTETLRDSLTATLLSYYRSNPDDPYAPECLDKVHLIYSAKRDYVTAAKYADTLLEKYPKYVNRLMIIESQFNNYDMFIQPRDKEKARYYLELLLKEDKKMDKETRADWEYRLEYIDLTIEQLMEQNMTELK